jgi:hypothetical protein
MKMNNANKIVRLTNELQEIYAEIQRLGGGIIVNHNGVRVRLNHLRRGGTSHSVILEPNDFYISVGDNKFDD